MPSAVGSELIADAFEGAGGGQPGARGFEGVLRGRRAEFQARGFDDLLLSVEFVTGDIQLQQGPLDRRVRRVLAVLGDFAAGRRWVACGKQTPAASTSITSRRIICMDAFRGCGVAVDKRCEPRGTLRYTIVQSTRGLEVGLLESRQEGLLFITCEANEQRR